MRKMLLSFKPEVYEKIKSGKKKFEHRRNFPNESFFNRLRTVPYPANHHFGR